MTQTVWRRGRIHRSPEVETIELLKWMIPVIQKTRRANPSAGTSEQPHAAVAALEYAPCVNGKPCARPRVDGEPGDRPLSCVDGEPCARPRVVDGEPGVQPRVGDWGGRPRVGDLGDWRSIDGSRRRLTLGKSFWVNV
uniref:Uncharacterized protein n=1 Tax=Oryza glumipatula TaxID=40148 RepID=A0A0E0A9A0_9ORYZ